MPQLPQMLNCTFEFDGCEIKEVFSSDTTFPTAVVWKGIPARIESLFSEEPLMSASRPSRKARSVHRRISHISFQTVKCGIRLIDAALKSGKKNKNKQPEQFDNLGMYQIEVIKNIIKEIRKTSEFRWYIVSIPKSRTSHTFEAFQKETQKAVCSAHSDWCNTFGFRQTQVTKVI